MKLCHLINASPLVRILLLVTAILFAPCLGPVYAASEPGTVTIVVAQEPLNIDPLDSPKTPEGQVMMKNILEPLTDINPTDSSIMPRLAHSWKQIDANTWHFFLRKGVKFHDGKDFNAEAVVFNIKRLYETKLLSNTRNKFFTGFKMEGKALDSHTLEIKTDKPELLLPTLMGILAICSPSVPLDKLIRNPIGTGPYKFVKWDAGTQIMLERFDDYWGKQPQVKKAIYVWRGESSVRAAMVAIGEADLAPEIARQDANRPDMDYSYLNAETTFLRISSFENKWDPPLNDKRVRMAFNYAVDRDAIRGSIFSKDVIPATQLIVPSIFGYNPDLKVWPYDPQKAKQLLAEARKDGVPVDKEILLIVRIGWFPGGEELGEAVQTMYRAVGLNVKLKMMESGVQRAYNNKPFRPGPYILSKTHDNSRGDAVFTFFQNYHCKGVNSATCDRKLDDLIEKGQGATGEERKNLWRAAFKHINEELIPDVVLFHMVGSTRIGKRINFKPTMAIIYEIPLEQITFKE